MIATDSLSALQSLLSKNPECPIITTRALNLTRQVNKKGYTVSFIWVPSPCGITGNERADYLMKKGAQKPAIDCMFPPSIGKLKVWGSLYSAPTRIISTPCKKPLPPYKVTSNPQKEFPQIISNWDSTTQGDTRRHTAGLECTIGTYGKWPFSLKINATDAGYVKHPTHTPSATTSQSANPY